MQLKPGSLLQGGKYRVIRTLGQGGFGITYEAEQVLLKRKVALKEFFMKDCCERDAATSQVTVGTGSQRALVEKFRLKFVREAQMIAGFEHPHIVRVLDVFEENGTAYYVMENLPGGSLSDRIKKDGPLPEDQAEKYIRQVADALSYIHSHNTVHLDVKPSNILLNAKGDAVLIDFGISKHYDVSGEQTSSTPVGISKGYAPLEQGKDGDVSQFKPSTDIYALGATLYYLVTGLVPPDASDVNEDGLEKPKNVSDKIWTTIFSAMQPRRKDRPQDINAVLSLLGESPIVKEPNEDEERTVIKTPIISPSTDNASSIQNADSLPPKSPMAWLWALIAGLAAVVIAVILLVPKKETKVAPSLDTSLSEQHNTVNQTESTQQPILATEPEAHQQSEAPGTIRVVSEPAGASIWLDGKNTKKKTPCILEDILPGKHSIRLLLEGHDEDRGSVSVTSGKQVVFSRSLTPKVTNTPVEDQPNGKTIAAEDNNKEEAIPYLEVEKKPTFHGGDANEFSKWVNSKLVYPELARQNGVQGRVTLQFTVGTDGRVTNVKVIRGVDETLDNEAVRVVSSSPNWTPGSHYGRPVKVVFTFPVIFQLK